MTLLALFLGGDIDVDFLFWLEGCTMPVQGRIVGGWGWRATPTPIHYFIGPSQRLYVHSTKEIRQAGRQLSLFRFQMDNLCKLLKPVVFKLCNRIESITVL